MNLDFARRQPILSAVAAVLSLLGRADSWCRKKDQRQALGRHTHGLAQLFNSFRNKSSMYQVTKGGPWPPLRPEWLLFGGFASGFVPASDTHHNKRPFAGLGWMEHTTGKIEKLPRRLPAGIECLGLSAQ